MSDLADQVRTGLHKRNAVSRRVFDREATALAEISRKMAARFHRGGRLLAIGRGSGITDAQHVAVEFVHPVIVGKRALPALDLSLDVSRWIPAIAGRDDMVITFGDAADPELSAVAQLVRDRGALTLAMCGGVADYVVNDVDHDPFIQQEIAEIMYHALWETVHVFLEHRGSAHDTGRAGFLYPFLSHEQDTSALVDEVASSIRAKAQDDEALRLDVVELETRRIVDSARDIHVRLGRGGKLLIFGNGGSATDATDWAFDCVASPKGYRVIPALSLSAEPATITAVANDVGVESIFVRQLIAHAQPTDIAIAITTSGASVNIVQALCESRRRGLLTVALAGYGGGEIVKHDLVDHAIVIRSDYIPRIQEVHASVYHSILDLLETIQRNA
jgi:D-sedoheptulose 7-phosphate isomerase